MEALMSVIDDKFKKELEKQDFAKGNELTTQWVNDSFYNKMDYIVTIGYISLKVGFLHKTLRSWEIGMDYLALQELDSKINKLIHELEGYYYNGHKETFEYKPPKLKRRVLQSKTFPGYDVNDTKLNRFLETLNPEDIHQIFSGAHPTTIFYWTTEGGND